MNNKHMQIALVVITAALTGMLAGCNTMGRQPQFREATITPSQLTPGDSAVIAVDVKDRHEIVRTVEGVIREEPTLKLKLRDDGEAPDTKAGDNLWVLQVDVPFQAPPGEFMLDLTAYRSDGTPVPVRGAEGKTVPLTASLPIVIKSAGADAAGADAAK